jgi:hypothetical protein
MKSLKKYLYTLLILTVAMWGYSCGDSSTDAGEDDVEAIVGDWLSEGAQNVAPGLQGAPFRTARITATFNENGTYDVVSRDSTGSEVTFQGTYDLGMGEEGDIRTITLNQSAPTSLVSSGIFQIQGDNMTYEVIQTEPALDGITPATVEGGFGSTAFGGTPFGPVWTQRFARQ